MRYECVHARCLMIEWSWCRLVEGWGGKDWHTIWVVYSIEYEKLAAMWLEYMRLREKLLLMWDHVDQPNHLHEFPDLKHRFDVVCEQCGPLPTCWETALKEVQMILSRVSRGGYLRIYLIGILIM